MKGNLLYINYWKIYITNDELEQWLDKMALWSKQYWLILLEEKLRRVENEITIL